MKLVITGGYNVTFVLNTVWIRNTVVGSEYNFERSRLSFEETPSRYDGNSELDSIDFGLDN